jgi:hypothetical protein
LGPLFWRMFPAGDEYILSGRHVRDYMIAHLVVTSHLKRETFSGRKD